MARPGFLLQMEASVGDSVEHKTGCVRGQGYVNAHAACYAVGVRAAGTSLCGCALWAERLALSSQVSVIQMHTLAKYLPIPSYLVQRDGSL